MDAGELWSGFAVDPREPSHADLRASDADRERVRTVIADAYADGRLDREEHDERCDALLATRTLGGLPPLVADLVVAGPPADKGELVRRTASGVAVLSDAQIAAQAQRQWTSERRSAVFGFLGPTLICWVIWSVVMFGGFPWPAIVTAATGLNLLRTLASHDEIVDRERRHLEKKRAKQLEGP